MPFELDHAFVLTSVGAPEAEPLLELGLSEGTPNQHEGQGTANRRFFFRNVMLELAWVHDAVKARSAPASRLYLWDRWQQRSSGASPFGVCLRPAAGAVGDPFRGWKYRPPYLPEGRWIHVAESSARIDEPLLFYIPWGRRPDQWPAQKRERLDHDLGVETVTSLMLTIPESRGSSAALNSLVHAGIVSIRFGGQPLMEIVFDHQECGRSADLRPALPLVLRW